LRGQRIGNRQRGNRRHGFREQSPSQLGFLHQRTDGSDHQRRFEGFAQNRITAGRASLLLIQRLELARGEDDPYVTMELFDVAAEIETSTAG
jgi:hypothetical protein